MSGKERKAELVAERRRADAVRELAERDRREEVHSILNEITDYDEDTGVRKLDYDKLAAILHSLGYRAWTT